MIELSTEEKQNLILLLESKNVDSIFVALSMIEGFGGLTTAWLARIIPYICYDNESLLSLLDKEKLELFWQQQPQNDALQNLWVSYMIFIHGDGYYSHKRGSEYTLIANIQKDTEKNVWDKFAPYQEIYTKILNSSPTQMWAQLFFKTACNLQSSYYAPIKKRALWFIDQLVTAFPKHPLYLFLQGYLYGIVHQNSTLGISCFQKTLDTLDSINQLEQEFEELITSYYKEYYPHESRFASHVYKYLEFYPTKVLVLRYLTDLHLLEQKEELALYYAKQALQITTNDKDIPFSFLGNYYYKNNDLQRAIAVLKLGLNAEVPKTKGFYLTDKHQRHQIHLDEKYAMAMLLGDIAINHYQDADKAMKYYRKAKDLAPQKASSYQRRILIVIYVYKDVFQADSLLNKMIKAIGNTTFTKKYKAIIQQKRAY